MAPRHVCAILNRGLCEFAKAAGTDVARRRRGLHHKLFSCIVLCLSGPIAAGQVTNVQFSDENPALYVLAGTISWDPPADLTGITHYLVHPACSPDLSFENAGDGPIIVHHGPGGTLQDVPVGTNSIRGVAGNNDFFYKACSGTQFQNPWAAYFVVVPMPDQGVATYGVSHCYDYVDAANGGTVPDPPPLLFGTFSDTDADAGEVGGTLTWTVDGTYNYGTYDYTLLSDHAIYLALDAGGTGGFELATVEPGSLSYTIPDNTDQQTATCLLMYGKNRLGISATPSFSHCFEAASGSFTTTTVSEVTSTTSLTVTNTLDPNQAIITNVGFTDTSGSGYWIDGTVTWVAPDNPAFEYFRIVMSATSTGADGAVMVDNIDRTARSYEIVNSDARGIVRGTNTGGIWANYIVVQAYRSGAFSPANEAGSVMLTDIANAAVGTFGGDWAGLALVDSIAFTDGNPAENLLTGTVTWTFSATTDYGFASDWRVYIADDTQGTNRQLLGTVAKHLTELSITDEACDPTHVYVLVYANNEHGESPNASSVSFWDDGLGTSTFTSTTSQTETGTVTVTTTLFTVGVGNVQFTDTVDTYFSIGGVLTWEEPADTSGITEYRVRLVFDVAASREQLVYEPDLGFATAVPVGTTRFKILDNTQRRFACCDPSSYPAAWLIVYIVNGSIQQEAIYAGHALIRDNQTTHVADSIYVQELQIVDTTPEAQINITLTGELYWNTSGPEYPNVGEDWSLIDQWDIYLAQGSSLSSSQRYIASVPLATKSYIFTAQPLNQGDDTIIVYASNAVGKAPFGSVVQFGQFGGLQTTSTTTYSSTSTKPLTSMSGLTVTFTDTDTDAGTLLGTITWDPPADPSLLTSYDIYMSSDQQGSNQQQLALVPSNTNSYTISAPATRTTGTAFPANWLLVYPSIGGTISTYIDAASLPLYDNSGAVPDQPSFATITFADEDPAGNFASGTVRWTLAATIDFGHITHYAVYLAEDQAGLNKVAFGDPVTWDVTEVVVGTGIELSSRYHVVIYAVNTYGESLQPGNIASSGGTSITFGDLGSSTTTTATVTSSTATGAATSTSQTTTVTTTTSSVTQTGAATSTSQTATVTTRRSSMTQTGTATSTSQTTTVTTTRSSVTQTGTATSTSQTTTVTTTRSSVTQTGTATSTSQTTTVTTTRSSVTQTGTATSTSQASSSTASTTTSSSTTTTVCSPVLDFSIEIMEGICDLSNWGMLSADAVSCEPATTPFVQLALANKMFSHCGAWCLFDFNQPDEVSFYWNNAEKCFQQSGFCNSEHPDEQELAVARQKSFCSTTTTSTGTSTTSTTTVQHVIQLPADVSVNTVEGRIVESTLWEALALMEMQADSLLTATAWGNVTVAKLRSLAADFDSSDRVVFSTDIAGGVRGVTVSVPLQLVQNLMQGANPMLAVTEVLPHVSETMPSNGEGSSQVVLNSPVVEISILLEAQGRVSVATVSDLAEPILVRLSDASQQPQDVCAFFDHTSRAWSSVGLQAISVNDLSGRWCQSTHLSILAIVHVVPFEGLIAEQDTSFELTSIALACASLFAGGGVVFLLWYYRCKPARGGSVQIQGKGDQTFVVTYSRSTRSADHEPDEPMKSISTKSLSFQAFRSEASASAASKVHIEWNIQANDWKTRLHDLEGWTGDLKQHHATQAAEVGRGRPGPASTDATKDAPDLLATLKRAETAAMEEAERLDFLVEVDAPVPVDSLQVAEDPQKAARPSFYRNGEAVLYFSITNQCWLLARIQGDPAWMNSEEQIDRDFLPTGELPHYDCILPGPKQLRHRVPLSQLRQRLRCGESVHVHVEEVTHGRRSRASRTWSWKSGHIHKIPPVAMTTVDPYAVTLSSGDKINVDLGRIRRFYETGSRVRVFRGRHGWHYGTVFEDAVEAATTTSDSLLAKSMESVNADKHIQVRLDGTDDVVPMSCYLVHSCLFSF